jgi:hypothetical protein
VRRAGFLRGFGQAEKGIKSSHAVNIVAGDIHVPADLQDILEGNLFFRLLDRPEQGQQIVPVIWKFIVKSDRIIQSLMTH